MRVNNIIKKSLIIFLIIILYAINTFASTDQSEIDVRAKMIFDSYYNDVIIYIQSNNVKMTQDNDYYYFEVSQDLINNTSFSGNYECNYYPSMIVSNMSDINSLRIRIEEAVHTSERIEKVYYGFNGDGSRNLVTNYNMNYNGSIRTDTNSVNYYIADRYLVHNNPNAERISLRMTGSGQVGNTFNLNTQFKINKDSISGLRYFSFLFHKVYSKLSTGGNFTGQVKCGITNYTIDLLQYIDCDHEFELRECDEEKHSIYCHKCEWLINDYHNYDIAYDNIENDECICGLRKQIRLTHKNNLNDIVIEKLATPNEIIEYEDNYDYIKGHTLLYYEDMELIDNNWDLATKSIIATMPNAVPLNSHIYNAIYKVNSYYINYSKANNLNLEFDTQMEPIKLDYGEKYILDKNVYIKTGYNFLGWGIRPNIDKEVFDDLAEVESLSDIDGDIVTLYPVFSPYEYTIHYIDYRYGKDYYKKYRYDTIESLDINTNLKTNDTFYGFKYNDKMIFIKNTSDIQKYILNNNDIITLEAQYNVDTNEHEIITEEKIQVLFESNDVVNEFNNELPIVVNIVKVDKDRLINNDDIMIDDYDKNIMDIFLSANIKSINRIKNNIMNGNNWMKGINEIILKIKEFLNNSMLLRIIVRLLIIVSFISILLLLLIMILYYIKQKYSENNIDNQLVK